MSRAAFAVALVGGVYLGIFELIRNRPAIDRFLNKRFLNSNPVDGDRSDGPVTPEDPGPLHDSPNDGAAVAFQQYFRAEDAYQAVIPSEMKRTRSQAERFIMHHQLEALKRLEPAEREHIVGYMRRTQERVVEEGNSHGITVELSYLSLLMAIDNGYQSDYHGKTDEASVQRYLNTFRLLVP